MQTAKAKDPMPAYSEAVKSGLYAKKSGLVGKYDNVRRYWEDEITRQILRPHLQRLIDYCQARMRRVRVLDLGCGSADGYELLTGVIRRDPNLHETEVNLLTPDVLGIYKGVDLNQDLLDQAREIYGHNAKQVFAQGDFTQGLPLDDDECFDLYFSSFGTFSHHNDDATAIRLIADIAQRTDDYSILVCDWLGRYSYEWQTLWSHELAQNRNMDYVVSYIYEKEEREARRDELQHLNLRLICRQEAETIIAAAAQQTGVKIKPLVHYDRSIFTGRHMDTAEYNPHAQALRESVNSLHEANCRTDLSTLIIDYAPKPGFDMLNQYFEHLQMCWNMLVQHTMRLLEMYDEKNQRYYSAPTTAPASFPRALQKAMNNMCRVVEGVGWLQSGLPRENIIGPQLGYALRNLVCHLQSGQGCAHGLIGIYEIDKRE